MHRVRIDIMFMCASRDLIALPWKRIPALSRCNRIVTSANQCSIYIIFSCLAGLEYRDCINARAIV